ncbi:MAG: RHS repeat-associated core domain-containing protein [Pyrinomonadaceae bacterium]
MLFFKMTDGTNTESYSYDAVGNRTMSGYTTGAFNRLTATNSASYSYNNNGSMTGKTVGSTSWSYGRDRENRLISASTGDTMNYAYDALGRRTSSHFVPFIASTNDPAPTRFTYDGPDVILDDNSNLETTSLVKYQNAPGIDNKLAMTGDQRTNYFLQDHLGSTVGLAATSGGVEANSYDSFGNSTNSSFSSRYQFTGREFDSFSGLQYSRARFYDPQIGRFISEDPIGFAGGINLYAYVGNRPTMFADPTGLFPSWWKFNYHADITRHGLYGLASPGQIEAVVSANTDYDRRTQDSIYAPYHAMSRPGQSPEEARAEANESVRKRICEARKFAAQGNEAAAMSSLGPATHTVQDNYSPAHSGFKPAWPNHWLSNIAFYPAHVLWETAFPGSENKDNAARATTDVWRYYKGAPLPIDFFGGPTGSGAGCQCP